MNMQRCRTCKWWEMFLEEEDPNTATEGECMLTEVRSGEPTHPHSLAIGGGIDSYELSLITKPGFGCVQHESREADQ